MHQFPVYFLNISMPTDAYDVNITPDKRSIMFHNEKVMVESIKEQMRIKYEPSRGQLSNGAGSFGPKAGRGAKKQAKGGADEVAEEAEEEAGCGK
ncbi:hypothetical protein T484DRAFT_1793590 [Baffinella frigidus]|nr:hypothetical protein T484DRAFT_1793590 [Cryptophyta sp. CCMP2293]